MKGSDAAAAALSKPSQNIIQTNHSQIGVPLAVVHPDVNRIPLAAHIATSLASRVEGELIEIHHQGPSIVSLHSTLLPHDGSALHFLRGAGIPDEWIDFYRSTMMHPIEYQSVFISYSSDDESISKRLHADLQANGVRCWFAPHNLKPDDFFRQEEIDKAIHL